MYACFCIKKAEQNENPYKQGDWEWVEGIKTRARLFLSISFYIVLISEPWKYSIYFKNRINTPEIEYKWKQKNSIHKVNSITTQEEN